MLLAGSLGSEIRFPITQGIRSMSGFLNRIAEGLFFETDRRQYWDYRQFGLQGEEFATKGPEGTSISGLWLKALPQDGKTLQGTVLYAHNCTRNYGYHLPQVSWLVPAGWNVVLYDPEETGRSTGKLTLNGMVDDAEAVYQYVRGQRGVSAKKLVLFGQGPGGESLLRLLHRPPDGAAAIVLEAVTATHRGWMIRRYGPGVGHLGAALLPSTITENPIDALRELKIPVAYLYPGRDDSVPEKEMDDMLKALPENREIWMALKEKHLTAFGYPTEWRDHFIQFAEKSIAK